MDKHLTSRPDSANASSTSCADQAAPGISIGTSASDQIRSVPIHLFPTFRPAVRLPNPLFQFKGSSSEDELGAPGSRPASGR